jgi:hypothetical protein
MMLSELVNKYQDGSKNLFSEIEKALKSGKTVNAALISVCGRTEQGHLDQGAASIEPFQFNTEELNKVFNDKLKKALKTFEPGNNTKFESWFYRLYRQGLTELKREYIKKQLDGETLKTFEELQEILSIPGSPDHQSIIKSNTNFNSDLLQRMGPGEKAFCSLKLSCYSERIDITDQVAGQALGVSRRQILRYKANLKKILHDYKTAKKSDDLPALINEFGACDPTPRQAAKNLRSMSHF